MIAQQSSKHFKEAHAEYVERSIALETFKDSMGA